MCAGNLTTIDSDNLISALNLKFLHVKLDSPCENRKCIDPVSPLDRTLHLTTVFNSLRPSDTYMRR